MVRAIVGMLLLGLCGAVPRADDTVYSGPQPGEKIAPFQVIQITGPRTAKELEIAGAKETGPMLLVFAHGISEPALGLMITLESYAHKHADLSGHYVLLADDRAETEQQVRRWWQRPFFARSPMSISVDGPEGPGSYGLNRKVDMTVLVIKENKVAANFALRGPNNEDAPKILAAVAKAMGKPVPSIEKIREELRAERERRRAERLKENPVFKLAPDPELGQLMLQLLFREGNTKEYIADAAEAMAKWAGDDAEKKADLVKYCRAILQGNFEVSRDAAEALKKLAEIE